MAVESSEQGFTLVELIVVITILGIMLFLFIPRFDGPRMDDINGVSRWLMANVAHLKTQAVEEKKRFILTVELDANAFSITAEANGDENPEADEDPAPKTFELPPDIQLVDVEYLIKGVVSTGKTDINFYPKGYSDKAVIHIRDEDSRLYSVVIEPFLPTVRISDEPVRFQ